MRKTLAIILSVAMLLSIVVIGVSAYERPESEIKKITTEAEFLAMEPNGYYSIENDLTLTKTYEQPFSGEIYGKNHKITLSAPMFEDFNGGICDLTLEGKITASKQDVGAVARKASAPNGEDITFLNITVNVEIEITDVEVAKVDANNNPTEIGGGKYAGGVLGFGDKYANLKFINCKNTKSVTNSSVLVNYSSEDNVTKGINFNVYAGGIVGRCYRAEFRFCENSGNITSKANRGGAAGIAANAGYGGGTYDVDAYDCINTGDITSNYDAGGMFAYLGSSGNRVDTYYLVRCANYGTIKGGYRVGGMFGYSYATGSSTNAYWTMEGCVSVGDVYGGLTYADKSIGEAFVGLLTGYSNSCYNTYRNCFAQGRILLNEGASDKDEAGTLKFFRCVLGCSSAKVMTMPIENLYICDYGTTEYYTYATAAKNAEQVIPFDQAREGVKRCTEDEIANVVTTLNTALNGLAQDANEQDVLVVNNGKVEFDATKRAARLAADKTDIMIVTTTEEIEDTDTETEEGDDTTTEAVPTSEKPNNNTTKPSENNTTAAPSPNEGGCAGCGGFTAVAALAAVLVGSAAFVVVKKKF